MRISGVCDTINIRPSGTPPGYPVVALCHGDLAGFDQQDQPFHTPQQFTDDIDVGMSQLKALGLGYLR